MAETITVMYWNVQDLGVFSPDRRGVDFKPICNFIGGFAARFNVDVFCLMESREWFVPHLDTLMKAMDDAFKKAGKDSNWFYDWIPGSIKGDLTTRFEEDDPPNARKKRKTADYGTREDKRRMPTKFNELAYTMTGHNEGYVIFWNEDSTSFDIVSRNSGPSGGVNTGLNGDHAKAKHAINLVYTGRQIEGWVQTQGVQRAHWQLAASGYSPTNPGNTDWALLDFCERSLTVGHWYAVRRPAYCVLSVANQGSDSARYLPIVVFHAPSAEASGAFGGTDRCGLSLQIYEALPPEGGGDDWVTANRVVIGGDFNVSSQHEYSYVFETFTSNRGANNNSGAGCTQFVPSREDEIDDYLSKSIVRVTKPSPDGGGYRNMIQILPGTGGTDSNELYRSLAVDNIFTRGFSTAVPPKPDYQVFNLQEDLQTNGSTVATLAKASFYAFIKNETKNMARNKDGNPVGAFGGIYYPNILDYAAMMTQLNATHFTSPRRTAEFTNTFLSDHMPLIVTVTT
jgi:hypothetical protein